MRQHIDSMRKLYEENIFLTSHKQTTVPVPHLAIDKHALCHEARLFVVAMALAGHAAKYRMRVDGV